MNSQGSFELKDVTKPYFLHYQRKKFWEIKLLKISQDEFEVAVRVGKLGEDGMEIPESLDATNKRIKTMDDAYTYVESHINKKISKGYEFLEGPTFVIRKESEQEPTEEERLKKIIRGEYENNIPQKISINVIPPQTPEDNPNFMVIEKSQASSSTQKESLKRKAQDSITRDELKRLKELLPSNEREEELESVSLKDFQFVINYDSKEKSASRVPSPRVDSQKNELKQNDNTDLIISKDSPKSFTERLNEFKGDYLVTDTSKGKKFCRIQVFDCYVKIEHGMVTTKKASDIEIKRYKDKTDAVLQAQAKIEQKLTDGYNLSQSKTFVYNFDPEEVGIKISNICIGGVPRSVISNSSGSQHSRPDKKSFSKQNKNGGRSPLPEVAEELKVTEIISSKNRGDKSKIKVPDTKENGTHSRTRSRKSSYNEDDDDNADAISVNRSAYNSPNKEKNPDQYPFGSMREKKYIDLMMPDKFDGKRAVTGWLWCEMPGGIRAFWDGIRFWAKGGTGTYKPPAWFVDKFPKSPLDGEFCMGRGKGLYNKKECMKALKKDRPNDNDWAQIVFNVYDVPHVQGTFRKRYEKMQEYFIEHPSPYFKLVEFKKCESIEKVYKELENVEKNGGEGIFLKDPGAFYEKGKQKTFLILKKNHDQRAKLIDYEFGKSDKVECKALQVINNEGFTFFIRSGLTQEIKKNLPEKGSIIIYEHDDYNQNGAPKNPKFVRVEYDEDND